MYHLYQGDIIDCAINRHNEEFTGFFEELKKRMEWQNSPRGAPGVETRPFFHSALSYDHEKYNILYGRFMLNDGKKNIRQVVIKSNPRNGNLSLAFFLEEKEEFKREYGYASKFLLEEKWKEIKIFLTSVTLTA